MSWSKVQKMKRKPFNKINSEKFEIAKQILSFWKVSEQKL